MKNLNRLSMHLAAAAVAATAATSASAAIVHRPGVNISIPLTTAGVYVNVVTGAASTTPGGAPGWDINPWSATGFGLFNPAAPVGGVYVQRPGAPSGTVGNLPFGTLIGPASVYGGNLSTNTPAATGFILNSSDNIIGFRFQNEANGNQIHYGWFRVAFTGGLGTAGRTIVEYAFEDVAGRPIEAGAIPAPGAAGLLALGGLVAARRRRA